MIYSGDVTIVTQTNEYYVSPTSSVPVYEENFIYHLPWLGVAVIITIAILAFYVFVKHFLEKKS